MPIYIIKKIVHQYYKRNEPNEKEVFSWALLNPYREDVKSKKIIKIIKSDNSRQEGKP